DSSLPVLIPAYRQAGLIQFILILFSNLTTLYSNLKIYGMRKIVVIGSSNVDLIMKMKHLPEKGETVTDAEFFQVFGGKGANQAVAAARAGGNVAFVSCVGDDAYMPQM